MTTYRKIHGRSIQAVTTDPTGDITEGQIWYNTASDTFKTVLASEAWASSGPLITKQQGINSFGTQTAAVGAGGYNSPPAGRPAITQEYNGTGFSSGGNMPAGKSDGAGFGVLTAGAVCGGYLTTQVDTTFEYDGSSWTAGGALGTARYGLGGAGTQTAGLAFAGATYPPTTNKNESEEYNGTSWSEGNNLNTARRNIFGFGTQTAGVGAGGQTPSHSTATEEYDGTSWSEVNNFNTARSQGGSSGIQTSGLIFGGEGSPSFLSVTEKYDGTSWTEVADLATGRRRGIGGAGSDSTAAVAFGGQVSPGGPTNQTSVTEEFTNSINVITAAAWASGGNLGTSRYDGGGGGTQTTALAWGGNTPGGLTGNTEKYDGTSWTESGNLATARSGNLGFGTQTAAVATGGYSGSPPGLTNNEHFDGSSWTSATAYPKNVQGLAGFGTQTAGAVVGGSSAGTPYATECNEYDGSSWTSSGACPRGISRWVCGTQTAAIGRSGSSTVASQEYDGSSWTDSGAMLQARGGPGGGGSQTAAICAGGGPAPANSNTEEYNGTIWFTAAGNLGTNVDSDSSARALITDKAVLMAGGRPNGGAGTQTNATQEYTGETSSVNLKTLTQS